MPSLPCPTDPQSNSGDDFEHKRWSRLYSDHELFYGTEPGPIARRAVRYHRCFMINGGAALDAGCGEGQDVAFLAERGYAVTGLELTSQGVLKGRRFLDQHDLCARLCQVDLRKHHIEGTFDLVLAVNVIQFLGNEAENCLAKLMAAVAPGGVIGLSLFAREGGHPPVDGTIFRIAFDELLARFSTWQPLEAAHLWQWNLETGQPQSFVTLIARNITPR